MTGWSIGEDKAICDGTVNKGILQENIFTIGKIYKITFDVDVTSGTLSSRIRFKNDFSATTIANISASGSYTFYQEADRTGLEYIMLSDNTATSSITNISVKEVGQNWVFSSGAFITDIGARLTHTPTAGTITSLGYSPLVIGNNYKMTYEITESISGGIKLNSAVVNTMVSTIGIHTKYFEATGNSISFARTDPSGNDVTISNISVIEITTETSLPRINYENFSYQDALGSELVTNGSFDNGSANWILGGTAQVSNGVGNFFSNGDYIRQSSIFSANVNYKITFDINLISGTIYAAYDGTNGPTTISEVGSTKQTVYYNTPTGGNLWFYGITFRGSIDNVSVKEYFGQEVVPDSGCGSWLFEPQSTNLITYSEDFTSVEWFSSMVLTSGFTSPDGTSGATRCCQEME